VHTYFRVRHGWYFKANPGWFIEYFMLPDIPDIKGYFEFRDIRLSALGFPDMLAASAFFLFTFSFLIKFPVFPVASWLPEAHVEASTEASVLLAAVLLKVAPFGFYKVIIPSFTVYYIQYCSYLWVIGLSSAIVYVFSLLVQTDLKRAIAYTSIIHMSIMLCLLGSTNKTSLDSAFLMGALHSFCSAGLFCSIGYLYEKDKTKNLNYVSGLAETRPVFSALFMLFNLVNVGYPLIGSYISEILLFVVAEDSKNRVYTFTVVLVLYVLTSAVFFMMSKLFYRSWRGYDSRKILDLTRDEYFSLILLFIICTLLGLFPNMYLVYIEDSMFNLLGIIKLAKII
jgi:NADH-quinone oxidoreductase subunit M